MENPKDKYGKTKPSISVVPSSSIIHLGMAMTNGAEKYGKYNWRDKHVLASVYVDATYRHVMSWYDSKEQCAKDSGVHHLAHAMACLAILIDAEEAGCLIDDRPPKGVAVELIERLTKVS